MMISARRFFVALAFLSLPLALVAQDIASWAVPPYWSPPATIRTPEKADSDAARIGIESIETVPTPPLALTGINPCRIADTRANGYYAPQAVVNTVNGLSGAVTLSAGTNVSITPSGNTLTIASSGGAASGWSLTGNSGTTAGTNFLGTTDNQPLELKVNGLRAFR